MVIEVVASALFGAIGAIAHINYKKYWYQPNDPRHAVKLAVDFLVTVKVAVNSG